MKGRRTPRGDGQILRLFPLSGKGAKGPKRKSRAAWFRPRTRRKRPGNISKEKGKKKGIFLKRGRKKRVPTCG